jgi:hypothetical protein
MSEQLVTVEETNFKLTQIINDTANGKEAAESETGGESKIEKGEKRRQHFSKEGRREAVKAALQATFEKSRKDIEQRRGEREIVLSKSTEDNLISEATPEGTFAHTKACLDHYEKCKETHHECVRLLQERIVSLHLKCLDEIEEFNEHYHKGEKPTIRIIAFGVVL